MRRSLAALALALLLPLPALAGTITVKPGETLSEIADRLGISMKRLMELNGINKADHVEVGQKLKVPGRAGSSSRSSGGGAVATGRLTVREGDTLSEIAARQGMSLNQLIALNGLSKADHVEVGQTLKVTGKVATAAAPTPFRKGANVHVVRSGESLSAIADGYGVPMSRLVAINAINDPDHVEVGSQLKLKGEPAAPRPRPAVAAAPRPTPAPAPRERPVQAEAPRPEPAAAAEVPKTSQPVVTQAIASASTAVAPTSSAIAPAASSWQPTPAATASLPITPASTAAAAPIGTTPVARTPIAAAAAAASTPVAAAVPTPRPSTAAASINPRPVAPQTRTPSPAAAQASAPSAAVATNSWRRYGPLQVDWSNWQPMGGSLVAPILNAKGDTLYLAINCGARKMNATSAAGDWRTWDDPQADFERRLVNDLCSSRG
ncbi:LysM peptidoglycan-binding domain-containing protein [Vulcanococcus limneticus]|uniref:LysM peptidoglycan-binding domain-containing protein n=1 Tax=Vulcanococcus limneticus TaxID=2170428 RepID=UPI00398BE398